MRVLILFDTRLYLVFTTEEEAFILARAIAEDLEEAKKLAEISLCPEREFGPSVFERISNCLGVDAKAWLGRWEDSRVSGILHGPIDLTLVLP